MKNLGKSSQKLLLGYWDYPGKCQHIRLLLEYTQIPYAEKTYTWKLKDDWFQKDKKEMDLKLPNLPYLIDSNNNLSLTESTNIMGYLADLSQSELRGKNSDKYVVDNIRFLLDEVGTRGYVSSIKQAEQKAKDWETVYLPKFKKLAQFYEKSDYAVGYLTIAEFYLFQRLNDFKVWYPEEYNRDLSQTFDKVLDNFSGLPGIKEFMESDRYIKY